MRSDSDKLIAGVCGGLADYLGIDPVLVRLAFVVLLLASGIGLVIYLILWVVMPSESRSSEEDLIVITPEMTNPAEYKAQLRIGPAGTVGVILILFGGFFLLNQVGWVSGAFWPIVLIGAGIYFLVRRARQSQ